MDLLACGSCKRNFQLSNILGFVKHKKFDCEEPGDLSDPRTKTLLCQSCQQKFYTPWSLLKHAQSVHFLEIYMEQELKSFGVHDVSIQKDPEDAFLNEITPPQKLATSFSSILSASAWDSGKSRKQQVKQKTSTFEIATQTSDTLSGIPDEEKTRQSKKAAAPHDRSEQGDEGVFGKEDQGCCDSQDCGITVMPGTHESLKKCCSAVVPKKRKRHMAEKHRSIGRFRRREKIRAQSPPSIYIDVARDYSSAETDKQAALNPITEQATESTSRSSFAKEKSVIIQPGSTLSIPVSYATGGPTPLLNILGQQIKLPAASFTYINRGKPTREKNTRESHPVTSSSRQVQSGVTFYSQSLAASSEPTPTPSGTMPELLGGVVKLEKPQLEPGLTDESLGGEEIISQLEADDSRDLELFEVVGGDPDPQDSSRGLAGKKRRYPTSRPYKCDQCDNAFNQRIHLKKHQSKHTGIKPYKCDHCDYATVERSHLRVHIRVHTGEKPFKCTYCEYATAQNSTLKIHLKRHHAASDQVYHCSDCDKQFIEKGLLDTHSAAEHHMELIVQDLPLEGPGQSKSTPSEGGQVEAEHNMELLVQEDQEGPGQSKSTPSEGCQVAAEHSMELTVQDLPLDQEGPGQSKSTPSEGGQVEEGKSTDAEGE